MASGEIQAIDVHAHFGTYHRATGPALINKFVSADADTVVARAERANIRTSIVSPLAGLLPRGQADAVAGNREAARITAGTPALRQWVIAHPLQLETFNQVDEMLDQPQAVGIKIHPEEHEYSICDHGRMLFELASRHDAIVLAHSGDPRSWPADFIGFANTFPNVTLILAHLGNGGGAAGDPTLQVRAIQAAKHGNVFVDTSSSRSIIPGLIEWAVSEIGAERILFGSDAPLYSTAMQRARIDAAEISLADKQSILCDNATRLLGAMRGEVPC